MLLSVTQPSGVSVALPPGFSILGAGAAQTIDSIGFALFDAPSRLLPKSGALDVELLSPLDGRAYRVRRSLDSPEHWQIIHVESGWLAASGSSDAYHWLRTNLDVPDDQPLPALFRDIVRFSVPASLAWLSEAPGLRERKLAELVHLDRYPVGLRWLDGVVAETRAAIHQLECAVHELQGRDQFFDAISARFETTRAGAQAASAHVAEFRQQLEEARHGVERFESLGAELQEVERQLTTERLQVVEAEAQLESARQWLLLHERAEKASDEASRQRSEYERACSEVAKLAVPLADADQVRAAEQAGRVEVLGLERQQALLQEELSAVQKAESAAAELASAVQQQQQVEQRLSAAHERAMRLELTGRALQATTAEAKRIEVLLADVEHQISELDQLESQGARVKKLTSELDRQRQQLRDANRQADQLKFLEAAVRAVGVHLDDLRKGSSVTERLRVQESGNGAVKTEERTLVGHLRAAVDRQVAALERQLNDWRSQSRELSGAPQRVDQIRASMHQLQQEIDAARQTEIKIGAAPALKQQRKQLSEHFEQLKKSVDGYAKEQRDCADAAALAIQLKQELGNLDDPQAERQALLRQAARKKDLEAALRETTKALDDSRKRLAKLNERLAGIVESEHTLHAQEGRRDGAAEGYREYLTQQAILQLTATAQQDVANVTQKLDELRMAVSQAEARETALRASLNDVRQMPRLATDLEARLSEAESREAEWQAQQQAAADELAAAEHLREELRQQELQVATHLRAERLLLNARETVRQAEIALGTYVRKELAETASSFLQSLTNDPGAQFGWEWAQPPMVLSPGAARGLSEIEPEHQVWFVLALRLALASRASRFGVVFVSGLGSLMESPGFAERVRQLPGIHQLFALSGW